MNRPVATLIAGAAIATPALSWVQLAFAILGIGVVGMVHGAGDLAIVDHDRRFGFLALYSAVSASTLLWWTLYPAVALPAFLVASAIHFGIEDAREGSFHERLSRGVALVATPAALHVPDYSALLHAAGGPQSILPSYVPFIAAAGAVAALALIPSAWRRRDLHLAVGLAALLLLPPLVGFTVGFLVLHALPQTVSRRDRLGFATTIGYLRAVAPVLLMAMFLAAAVAALLLFFDPSGVRGLFASIAALAVPHLLVTPWYERREKTSAHPVVATVGQTASVQRPLLGR